MTSAGCSSTTRSAFPSPCATGLDDVAATSTLLREERELAFYGDVDFIPDERYDRATAEDVVARVDRVLAVLDRFEATL
jgi:hypothetical protein